MGWTLRFPPRSGSLTLSSLFLGIPGSCLYNLYLVSSFLFFCSNLNIRYLFWRAVDAQDYGDQACKMCSTQLQPYPPHWPPHRKTNHQRGSDERGAGKQSEHVPNQLTEVRVNPRVPGPRETGILYWNQRRSITKAGSGAFTFSTAFPVLFFSRFSHFLRFALD